MVVGMGGGGTEAFTGLLITFKSFFEIVIFSAILASLGSSIFLSSTLTSLTGLG